MRTLGGKQGIAIGLALAVAVAAAGWGAARQIRSPARVAAETAPPPASPITIPVVRRTLSTQVIVRGTVRYGAPQAVALGASKVKQGGSDIVTQPPRRQFRLGAGEVAMAVDGRPVFVLPGAVPMHRDLRPGVSGHDVRQLEEALAGLGVAPGAVDGRYDAATGAAVARLYLSKGWDPFGATDLQLEQLRVAEGAAAAARDAHLQARNTLEQARRGPLPADVAQARIDVVIARDAIATARLDERTALAKLGTARGQARIAPGAESVARAESRRDQAVADADVVTKQTALNTARDDERLARLRQAEVAPDAPPSEREAAAAAVRQAADGVARAQGELTAAVAAADAARSGASPALERARNDAAQATRDIRLASSELRRARVAIRTARHQASLATLRVRALTRPADTRTLRAISASGAQEARRTRAEVARLSSEAGIQLPANELLFFPTLPLRVDAVKAKRGDTVTGRVMSVTNSRLAIDSSLTVSDAKLIRRGDPVTIEEQDLGVRARGTVAQVADRPGTRKVDPTRVYLEIAPGAAPVKLVGASVKLTIAVKSTRGAVLAVPASALSVGGDGSSRVQVRRSGRTRLVSVLPGLAAGGLVEVRPAGKGRLAAGDLVVVGKRP